MMFKLEEVVDHPNIKHCMIEVKHEGSRLIKTCTEQGLDWWTFDEIEALYEYVQKLKSI